MDIDWTQIRGALSKIEKQLSKAQDVIKASDEATTQDWPEISRDELEAAFPNWRKEYGNNWVRDFLEKKLGRENYRSRRGSRRYRIAPECWEALDLARRGDS
jgi:hypothetical protein